MQQHIFSSAVHCIYLKYTCRWDTKIFLTPEFFLFFLTKLTNFLIVKDCKCICVITNLHNYRHVLHSLCITQKSPFFIGRYSSFLENDEYNCFKIFTFEFFRKPNNGHTFSPHILLLLSQSLLNLYYS